MESEAHHVGGVEEEGVAARSSILSFVGVVEHAADGVAEVSVAVALENISPLSCARSCLSQKD